MGCVILLEDAKRICKSPNQPLDKEAGNEEKPCSLTTVRLWDACVLVVRESFNVFQSTVMTVGLRVEAGRKTVIELGIRVGLCRLHDDSVQETQISESVMARSTSGEWQDGVKSEW